MPATWDATISSKGFGEHTRFWLITYGLLLIQPAGYLGVMRGCVSGHYLPSHRGSSSVYRPFWGREDSGDSWRNRGYAFPCSRPPGSGVDTKSKGSSFFAVQSSFLNHCGCCSKFSGGRQVNLKTLPAQTLDASCRFKTDRLLRSSSMLCTTKEWVPLASARTTPLKLQDRKRLNSTRPITH